MADDLDGPGHGGSVAGSLCPAGAHAYIGAMLTLVTEQDILPQDIEGITVFVGDFTRSLCEPLEERRRPATTLDAKYSLPFTLGVAAARRKVMIRDYTLEGLKDPAVLQLAQTVTPRYDAQFSRARGLPPGMVQIETKDGKMYSKRTDHPYGHPSRPMSWEDIVEKFRDCASYSARPLHKANLDRVVELVARLEEVEDVGEVIRLLG